MPGLSLLLLFYPFQPRIEHQDHRQQIDDPCRSPHQQSGQLLIFEGSQPPPAHMIGVPHRFREDN
jgi:hypothetical protein